MKKFFILVLGMIMLMLIPINVKADDQILPPYINHVSFISY